MSANFNNPTTSSTYTNFVSEVKERDDDIVKGMDPAVVTPTNVPTNALRWNSVNKYWEKYNGSTWSAMSADYAITITGSAAKWTTARTITLGTDLTGNVSIDGSANVTLNATLNTVTAAKGGTGQTTYAVGDLLYASSSNALSRLADVATGNALVSGGVGVAPSWGKVGLTTHVSGTLDVGNGGTGTTSISGVVYGNGSGAMTAASSAQISSAIGSTYVQNANYATNAGALDSLDSTAFVTRPQAGGRDGARGILRAGDVDGSGDYSYMVRPTWDGSRWLLRGYGVNSDTTYHAQARVEYADAAGSSTNAVYAENSSKLYSTDPVYSYTGVNPYYGYLTYMAGNNRWRFQVSPATPAAVEVAYADSAGNADTTDGLHAASSGVQPGANQLVRTDSNGYTFTGYINSSTGNDENPALSQVVVTNGYDNYYRKASIAHLTSSLSGTAPINISGNAATATSASSIDGVAFSNGSSSSPLTPDTVATNAIGYESGPSLFGYSDGGLYAATYDATWQHQMIGDFRSGQVAVRGKNNGSWTSWRTLLDSSNHTSYTPSLTGSGASGTWSINVTGSSGTTGSVNSKGNASGLVYTGRSVLASGVYTYGTYSDPNAPTTYFSAVGFGNGAGGSVELGGSWISAGMGLWYRSLRDTTDNWTGWTRILDASSYNSYSPTLTGGGASGTWNISIYGRGYPRKSDGNDINFIWSGQSGQPSWLWGGSDGTNMYVYNPSNFSVNYATSSGTAGYLSASVDDLSYIARSYNTSAGGASQFYIKHSYGSVEIGNFRGGISFLGNASTANNLITDRTNWSSNGTITAVVGQLAWKNYGNNHTIFDASAGTAPDGSAVNNTNAAVAWTGSYPTLMGWNGSSTYGVRVDSARVADSASSVAWTNVSGRPTNVSSFTNDSGYITSSGSVAALSTATGSAPSYSARAWVNFNGTGTVAIRASGNVSSITDNGTGDYTVNFSTAMPDADYTVVSMGGTHTPTSGNGNMLGIYSGGTYSTSAVRLAQKTLNSPTSAVDIDPCLVTVFR